MFVEIDENKKIHYEKSGSGQALIMVHGNGEDLTIFNEAVEKLKERFTVYALDTGGHGKSYEVSEYHYASFCEDVYKFIKQLNIEKPIFYGFSDGGIIGLMLGYKYPDLLSKLIVSGANLTPRGLKDLSYYGMKLEYFFTRSKRTKMMIYEPNITKSDLQKITVPTFVTAGQHDVIKSSHTKLIADNIKNSHLKIFKNHLHGSYIVHSKIIADYILEVV